MKKQNKLREKEGMKYKRNYEEQEMSEIYW